VPGYEKPDKYHRTPYGDFALWNDLVTKGHEVMPHSYKHANLKQLPFDEARDLIRRCQDVFAEKLKGFDGKQSIYNFAYLASTPQLERWLPTQVRAFRTGFRAINPWPYRGQTKLTCTSAGPENCEKALDRHIENLLKRDRGWLIFCAHGLDGEGWGPMRADYLDRLLGRLTAIDSVDVLPTGMALTKYAKGS
jgi:peptidoglycan/xylan/chitin deacetylase (PgdA/CDA1 family)